MIFGTLDAQLVALNRDTGKVVWKVKTDKYKVGHSITMAPFIVKGGKVIVRQCRKRVRRRGLGEGLRRQDGKAPMVSTRLSRVTWVISMARKMVSRARPTPHGQVIFGRPAEELPWVQGSYDPDLNLVYFGTGNPAPWNSHKRPGDNLYTASIIALDADTGKLVWHLQTVPNDAWDFDSVSELLLFDYKKGGKTIKAGAHAGPRTVTSM